MNIDCILKRLYLFQKQLFSTLWYDMWMLSTTKIRYLQFFFCLFLDNPVYGETCNIDWNKIFKKTTQKLPTLTCHGIKRPPPKWQIGLEVGGSTIVVLLAKSDGSVDQRLVWPSFHNGNWMWVTELPKY